MPCLVLTGFPSSGKSIFAKELSERALSHSSSQIKNVIIVNEDPKLLGNGSGVTRYENYLNSQKEKECRSALKTEFDKQVALSLKKRDTLVILDSLNYIKGYRYELHVISKAMNEKHGVIWIICPSDVAMKWNQNRIASAKEADTKKSEKYYYTDEMMEGLMRRYEPPDDRNRWDKPLYRVDLSQLLSLNNSGDHDNNGVGDSQNCETKKEATTAKNILDKSVYNMHSLSDAIEQDTVTNMDQQKKMKLKNKNKIATENSLSSEENDSRTPMQIKIDEILDSFLLDIKALKEGLSTRQNIAASSNVLNQVDSISKKITTQILQNQKTLGEGQKMPIQTSDGTVVYISLYRKVQLPQLRRLQRQFVKWVSQFPPEDTSERGVTNSFLSYIQDQI